MKKGLFIGVIAMAMSAAPAFAGAQTGQSRAGQSRAGQSKTDPGMRRSSSADQTFVKKAAEGGMAEVELGRLAAEKGSSSEVKQFGQKMADDHGKANDQLKSLAQTKNITLPTDLNAKDKALRDRLSKMSGAAFDRAYMRAMVTDHTKDVNEFKTEAKSGADADVKSWASNTLPTLETHLKMAHDANRAVGTSGTLPKSPKTPKTPK
jgi:putative membrane protein